MADRLTQLQDAVNAVSYTSYQNDCLSLVFSKLTTSVTASASSSRPRSPLPCQVSWSWSRDASNKYHCWQGGKGGHTPLDTDPTQLFAQMIARTGKDIEVSSLCLCETSVCQCCSCCSFSLREILSNLLLLSLRMSIQL